MSKRRSSLDTAQLGFTFDPPSPAQAEADLAGLDRVIAAAVGRGLKEDRRSRPEIAGAMSHLLDEEVSRLMLDAYASEARDQHNISAARFFAFVAVTERYDLLDHVMRRIGAACLVGEEIMVARAGHLRAKMAELKVELSEIERQARPIGRSRNVPGEE